MDELGQLRRLEPNLEAIAASGEYDVVPVGPFRAIIHRTTPSVWRNTAVPVEPLGTA